MPQIHLPHGYGNIHPNFIIRTITKNPGNIRVYAGESSVAQIVENLTGRRMVRLSPADVLTVVQVYQRQLFQSKQTHKNNLPSHSKALAVLAQQSIYLPEEI